MSILGPIAMKIGGYPLHLRKLQLLRLSEANRVRRLEDRCVAALRESLPRGMVSANVVTIMPTHRRPELLVRAIASALEQDIDDHHVLVLDDGGGLPDGIAADGRVTAVSLPVNTKICGLVRNVGLRISESPYVAFLDDDNTWTPEHLQRSLAVHTGRPMLSYTGMRRVFADGRVYDVLNEPWSRQRMKRFAFVDMSAIVARRFPGMRLSRVPRFADDSPGEDWQFVWSVSAKYPVVHVDSITVNYSVDQPGIYSPWRAHLSRGNDPDATGG